MDFEKDHFDEESELPQDDELGADTDEIVETEEEELVIGDEETDEPAAPAPKPAARLARKPAPKKAAKKKAAKKKPAKKKPARKSKPKAKKKAGKKGAKKKKRR